MRTFICGNLQCLYKKRWPKLALYVVVDGLKCDRKVFVERSSVDLQDLQKSGNFNLILLIAKDEEISSSSLLDKDSLIS